MSGPKVRVGTIHTEIVVDGGEGVLSIYHEPRGDDAGTGPFTEYTFMDGDGHRHKGPYLFTARQDGDLARRFFRGATNLDVIAAIAQSVRRVADALVKTATPV